ncbi:MAG: toxin [Thermodesulfovibrionia bacterium]
MKVFQWKNEKNEWLKKNRGVSFEQVVILMEREDVLEIVDHPNQEKYPGQKIATIRINDYAYLVPYIQESKTIFLKTIIPSRKATNKYVR